MSYQCCVYLAVLVTGVFSVGASLSENQLIIQNTPGPASPPPETADIDNEIEDNLDINEESFRQGRTHFPKIHEGLAFLAGLKIGHHIARDNSFGHGTFAASQSFKLFGKPINSAFSASYGDVEYLPFVQGPYDPVTETNRRIHVKSDDKALHLTVIENPTVEELQRLKEGTASQKTVKSCGDKCHVIKEELQAPKEDKQVKIDHVNQAQLFFKKHNELVRLQNEAIKKRINSKF